MLEHAFKIQKNTPRKDRYNFITDFNEYILIEIIKIYPYLIKILPKDRLTNTIIKTALEIDGYVLEYIEDQTPELVEIALKSQPLAIKHSKLR